MITQSTGSEHFETDVAELKLLAAPKSPDLHAAGTGSLSESPVGRQLPSGGDLAKFLSP